MIRGTKFSNASHHPLSVWTDAGFFVVLFNVLFFFFLKHYFLAN